MKIKIKYSQGAEKISKIEKGDWIDLRSNETIKYSANEFHLLDLGVAMEIPSGYEAHLAPRSGTFKNYGIIQTNGFGIIDNSYAGNNDIWKLPFYSLKAGKINKGDRVCQFRIIEKMPEIEFEEVENLENEDRGGFNSTGVK